MNVKPTTDTIQPTYTLTTDCEVEGHVWQWVTDGVWKCKYCPEVYEL